MIRGMARKKNRAGVLIFVSLAEHYARIVADDGIASKVRSVRVAGRDRRSSGARGQGRDLRRVIVIAVEKCGAVLAEHFPPESDDKDELPDRIYLI